MQNPETAASDDSSNLDEGALLELFKKVEVNGLSDVENLAHSFPDSQDRILAAIDSIRWVQDQLRERTRSVHYNGNAIQPPDESPQRQFGDYLIYRPIGSGGMGTIYYAWQISLNRPVAIKMLRSDIPNNTAEQFRFRAEALAAASLNHPNIVSIYDVGVVDGQPFYAMRYIEGSSLSECAATAPIRTFISWLIQIASAVSAAHERGILHRDIKPSNILIDSQGRPSLIDFGLAQYLTPISNDSLGTSAAGTVDYMSPEQAVGAKYLTVESDIFSLGVVLYELLTGTKPFHADSKFETLANIITQHPKPPHRVSTKRQAFNRDLSQVCLKALAKDPRQRYRSMDQFSLDLQNWLSGLPVTARKVNSVLRAIRWFGRRPLVAALALLLVAMSVSSIFGLIHLWKQRTIALGELETSNIKIEQSLYAIQLSRAMRSIDENALPTARRQLLECDKGSRGWEWNLLYRSALEGRTHVSFPLSSEPAAANWNDARKFRIIETNGHSHCFANVAGTIAKESQFDLGGHLQCAAIATNDLGCVCRSNSTEIELWDLALQKCTDRITLPGQQVLFLDVNEKQIAAVSIDDNNGLSLYVTSINGLVFRRIGLLEHRPIGISMNSEFVAAACSEGNVEVFRIFDGVRRVLHSQDFRVTTVGLDSFRNTLTASGGTASAYIAPGKFIEWDLETFPSMSSSRSKVLHDGEASSARVMASGSRLFTGSEDRTLRIWNSADWSELLSLRGHLDRICEVVFDPTENWLATTSNDHTVRFWDGSPLESFDDPSVKTIPLSSGPAAFLLNQDASKILVTSTRSPRAELWDHETCQVVDQIELPYSNTIRLGVSPDGTRVIGVDAKCRTWYWDRIQSTAHALSPLLDGLGKTYCRGMSIEDDGKLLISDGWHHLRTDLSLLSKSEPQRYSMVRQGPSYEFVSCVVSPIRKLILSADVFHRVSIRHPDSMDAGENLLTHKGEIRAVAFSPDENWVASTGYDGQVYMFHLPSKQSHLVTQSIEGFCALAFSKNGEYLAAGSIDGSVRVWDVATRQLAKVLPGHLGVIHQLGWSNDNRLIAISLIDQKLHVANWDVSQSDQE